jgi:hypothetical protein
MKPPRPRRSRTVSIQEMGDRLTSFGVVSYIKVRRHDDKPMGWRAVWKAFASSYPDCWAIQMFPPASELIDDEINVYHLYILHESPVGVNINWR